MTIQKTLTGVWDFLLDGVWSWHWDLNFDLVGLWHLNVVRLIDWNLDLVWDLLFDDNWVWFLHFHWIRFFDFDLVGPVDWDLHLIRDLLDDCVRLWNGDFVLDFIWDLLLDGVGNWDWDLDLDRDLLLNHVWLGHRNFNLVWLVDWNLMMKHVSLSNLLNIRSGCDVTYLHLIGDLGVDGVWLRDIFLDLDVFLDSVWDLLLHDVGLWNWDLDLIRYLLVNGVRHVLLDGVRYWDLLLDSYGLDVLILVMFWLIVNHVLRRQVNQVHVLRHHVVVLSFMRLWMGLVEGLRLSLVLEVGLWLSLMLIEGLWSCLEQLLRLLMVLLWLLLLLGKVRLEVTGCVRFLSFKLWLLELQLFMLVLNMVPIAQGDSTSLQFPVRFLLSFYASLTRGDVLIRCRRFAFALGSS